MSSNDRLMKRLRYELTATAKEGARRALQQPYADGYDEAANVTVQLLQSKIDDLHRRMKNQGGLSEKEQYLLAHLIDMKEELERALRDAWTELPQD
ncbi:hypothetical protein [Leifsonia sp. RAF41]|uniref:hypothetical protein n=1 Tax=Leifsonia sp. RAF41 TaxID=3233056 RepID=UPI003F9AC9C2